MWIHIGEGKSSTNQEENDNDIWHIWKAKLKKKYDRIPECEREWIISFSYILVIKTLIGTVALAVS